MLADASSRLFAGKLSGGTSSIMGDLFLKNFSLFRDFHRSL
jgi:hypothetical protein